MRAQPAPKTVRTRRRFDWTLVSDRVCRDLLACAIDAQDDGYAAPVVPEGQIRHYLARVFGNQPSMAALEKWQAWDCIYDWALREASAEELAHVVTAVQHQMTGSARHEELRTQAQRRAFLGARRRSNTTFRAAVLAAFVALHKSPQPVRVGPGGTPVGDEDGYVALLGHGAPSGELRDYQQKAIEGLDTLLAGRSVSSRSGLVVLPTGAGKTRVAVTWCLQQMARRRRTRVLWIAHQEELLLQAADTFQRLAAAQDPGFARRLRVISSGQSKPSTLVEPELDVAIVTWQSLASDWNRSWRRISTFMSRPTIVVVDEAHHAGSMSYRRILDHAAKSSPAWFVGLTATPWPTTSEAARSLRDRFPTTLVEVTPETLQAQKVLAVPVVHTIETKQRIELTDHEIALSAGDLHPSVLRKLQTEARDGLLIRTWKAAPDQWGKTLVFATSKAHADRLGHELGQAGAHVKVLHSGVDEHRSDILAWFRDRKHPTSVLVSVGMLTEGVDLPAARTAFLARPTTSRILMRQMIGRVLRGPSSGGGAVAHVVYLRDEWANFDDVLEPGELPDIPTVGSPGTDAKEALKLPPVRDEDGVPVPDDVLAQLQRAYRRRVARIPLDPATSRTVLVGYYVTATSNVPVMEHQRDGYSRLIKHTLAGAGFQGRPPMSFFEDDHPPYPTDRQLKDVRSHVELTGEEPPFVAMVAPVDPRAVAEEIRRRPLTDRQREALLKERFETTLARVAYKSLDHFEEAVERELRELRQAARAGRNPSNPERPSPPAKPTSEKVTLWRDPLRPEPDIRVVVERARELLDGVESVETLFNDGYVPPPVRWTEGDVTSTWAHWSLKMTGRNRGQAAIRINRRLQARKSQISEDLLEYLVFHELLHDLLPGRGHDAEFRRLESLWPGADQHDLMLDTLYEKFSMDGPAQPRPRGGRTR
ncbi:MAG: DEAD/DEAH box helicase [Actinobacteria bacterium]|nr:DEAD/DEAH box helicase [Actinomycetota bacterium]